MFVVRKISIERLEQCKKREGRLWKKYQSRQPTNHRELLMARQEDTEDLADLKVKTLFQSIPTLQPAFKEGHKCCLTMHPSGTKLHTDHSPSCDMEKERLFYSINQKIYFSIFPCLFFFFFCSQLSLKKSFTCNHMKQDRPDSKLWFISVFHHLYILHMSSWKVGWKCVYSE